jgi:hypothetical protein
VQHRPAAAATVARAVGGRARRLRSSTRTALADAGRAGPRPWPRRAGVRCCSPGPGWRSRSPPRRSPRRGPTGSGRGRSGSACCSPPRPSATSSACCSWGRLAPQVARRWLLPLTLLSVLPLIACAFQPPLLVALLLVVTSGVGTSFSLVARVLFVENVDHELRGRAFSVAATGVMLTQGLGILAAGAAAYVLPAPLAVAACGVLGLGLVTGALLLSRTPGCSGRRQVGRGRPGARHRPAGRAGPEGEPGARRVAAADPGGPPATCLRPGCRCSPAGPRRRAASRSPAG